MKALAYIAAWISRTPTAEQVLAERRQRQVTLDQSTLDLLSSVDDPAFLDACASLAQMGISSSDLERISHAIQHRRILAFRAGNVTDIGETGNWLDGSTRGSKAADL